MHSVATHCIVLSARENLASTHWVMHFLNHPVISNTLINTPCMPKQQSSHFISILIKKSANTNTTATGRSPTEGRPIGNQSFWLSAYCCTSLQPAMNQPQVLVTTNIQVNRTAGQQRNREMYTGEGSTWGRWGRGLPMLPMALAHFSLVAYL